MFQRVSLYAGMNQNTSHSSPVCPSAPCSFCIFHDSATRKIQSGRLIVSESLPQACFMMVSIQQRSSIFISGTMVINTCIGIFIFTWQMPLPHLSTVQPASSRHWKNSGDSFPHRSEREALSSAASSFGREYLYKKANPDRGWRRRQRKLGYGCKA